jgi:hypothetical protein
MNKTAQSVWKTACLFKDNIQDQASKLLSNQLNLLIMHYTFKYQVNFFTNG